jgi:hypothetical protein
MLKLFAIAILVLVAAILTFASTKPDTFHVERSINIKAAREIIFPFINDFRLCDAWTPYDKDPALKKAYSGSASGKGVRYAWEGNKEAGKGEIIISDTMPPNKLLFELHMIEPFEGRNVAAISLDAVGNSTNVTWSLDDKHDLKLKTLSLFLNLDNTIGKDFEVGLARLKAIAER